MARFPMVPLREGSWFIFYTLLSQILRILRNIVSSYMCGMASKVELMIFPYLCAGIQSKKIPGEHAWKVVVNVFLKEVHPPIPINNNLPFGKLT